MDLRLLGIVTRMTTVGPSRRDVLCGLLGVGLLPLGTRSGSAAMAKQKHSRKKDRPRCDVCSRGCSFRHVQSAIDAAKSGAIIRLCQGAYRERISITRNVTLIGAGRKRSFLDGGGAAGTTAVVTIGSGATVALRALTVRGGNGGDAGGIDNAGTLTIEEVDVSGNHAD